jgi:hypothetical protein
VGSSAFLLSVISAAAFRVVLGSDAGINYNTNALSTWNIDRYGEPMERTPWALTVRPDIMVAFFNQRNYGYLQGDGAFTQPYCWSAPEQCIDADADHQGDSPEGVGNLLFGGRFRLGRRLIFHPGLYVHVASSNAFVESQDEVTTSRIQSRPFNALYGGGWLEFEIPAGETLRFLSRTQVEFWYLNQFDPGNAFFIPFGVRYVQPDLIITEQFTTWIDMSRRNGLAVEITAEDSVFFQGTHVPYRDERVTLPDGYDPATVTTENQITLRGRVIYRRAWLPNLITDLSLGLMGLLPRESDREDPQPGQIRLAIGAWELNFVGGASLVYFGRPRWLTLRLAYERTYDELHFRNSGAIRDSIDLLAAFGPFHGFSIATTVSWSRFPVEVQRLQGEKCPNSHAGCVVDELPTADDEGQCDRFYGEGSGDRGTQCEYRDTWTRPFNTIGLNLETSYMHEFGDILFGPFFSGYVYAQIGEALTEEDQPLDTICQRTAYPYIDNTDCYMPPHHDPIEAILLLGLRLQWAGGNARTPRGEREMGGGAEGSRAERRLALQRMTREERNIPGYGYRFADTEDQDEGLFGADDPFGRINQDPLYQQVVDRPVDEDVEEATGDDEDWFGEEPEQRDEGASGDWGEGEEGDAGDAGAEGEEGPPDESGMLRDEYLPAEEPEDREE